MKMDTSSSESCKGKKKQKYQKMGILRKMPTGCHFMFLFNKFLQFDLQGVQTNLGGSRGNPQGPGGWIQQV